MSYFVEYGTGHLTPKVSRPPRATTCMAGHKIDETHVRIVGLNKLFGAAISIAG